MDEGELIEEFMLLTATLKSGPVKTSNKLQEAFEVLADILAWCPPSKSFYNASTELALDKSADVAALSNMDEESREEMLKIITEAIQSAEGPVAPQDIKCIFRRTVPFLTTKDSASMPNWAGGRSIEKTLGPFTDCYGRILWFDIYGATQNVSVVRQPLAGNKSTTILLLPYQGFQLIENNKYSIPKGSIWILSRLLALNAPKDAYSGIRVKGGTLHLSSPASMIKGQLVIGPQVEITLELLLDPPLNKKGLQGPVGDIRRSKCKLPSKVVFEFTYRGGLLKDGSDAAVGIYGNSFGLSFSQRIPRYRNSGIYEPLLDRVLLPLGIIAEEMGFSGKIKTQVLLEINSSESDLFFPYGSAPVLGGAWALPVAVASPETLGTANSAGGIAVILDHGIRAKWRGLAGGSASLGRTLLMVEPELIELATASATNPIGTHGLELWNSGSNKAQQSRIDLRFISPFPLHFINNLGLEALKMLAAMEVSIDRPIKADKSRIPLLAKDGDIVFWHDSNSFRIKVVAGFKGEMTTFPIALTNALLKVRSPYGLRVEASMPSPTQIQTGSLLLPLDVLMFIPMLRDPYVTNLLPRIESTEDPKPAVSAPIAGLLVFTKWEDLKNIDFVLQLMPKITDFVSYNATNLSRLFNIKRTLDILGQNESNSTALAHNINSEDKSACPEISALSEGKLPNPELTEAEDTHAESDLRDLFELKAGQVKEQLFLLDVSSNVDQMGVGLGFAYNLGGVGEYKSNVSMGTQPFQIRDMDLVLPERNLRVFMLPQIQWEPVTNIPTPNVGPFPQKTGSLDDGGPTLIGVNSVNLVPIAPDNLIEQIITEFNQDRNVDVAALFTLPFGMKAAALFQQYNSDISSWSSLNLIKLEAMNGVFKGGIQISARSCRRKARENIESPSFPGATYQTRNLVDRSRNPLGMSVLRGDISNEGTEAFFNNEMAPASSGGKNPRVPLTRIDFSGYGASMFSSWFNPNAVSSISQVCFNVMVGRTAYEVVQVSSILIPWAVPVVRTVTLERKKEGRVIRTDSGWIAIGSGLYRYPPPDPNKPKPPGWTAIETHPGLVRGVHNIRNIRETGNIIDKTDNSLLDSVDLLEVRFDGDFNIESAVVGQNGNGHVIGCNHIGYVQRSTTGYPLSSDQLKILMDEVGPVGGPVDCIVDIGASGQKMHVVRVDVDTTPSPIGPPHFAAAVRGSLELPGHGNWSIMRHENGAFQPVRPDIGVPVIRGGTESGSIIASPYYRIAEPGDLQKEDNPAIEFGIFQSSESHRIIFPRPRIQQNQTFISSTEIPLLADLYSLTGSVGLFPDKSVCFKGDTAYQLQIGANGEYTLGPSANMNFIPPEQRSLSYSETFKVNILYEQAASYELDAAKISKWFVSVPIVKVAMDLGPFSKLMTVAHSISMKDGVPAILKPVDPKIEYAPFLSTIVEIIKFLTELLGIDDVIQVVCSAGSFNFQAALDLPIEDPTDSNGYIDLPPMRIKGRLKLGVGNLPVWNGYLGINLSMEVPVLPPIYGLGEAAVMLKGSEVTNQDIAIQLTWGADIPINLKVIEVQGSIYYRLDVSVANGVWQIGLLVGVSGTVDLWIVTITARLELMAAVERKNDAVSAIGQARFAAEIEVCWFLTIDIDYTVEYETDDLGI